MYKLKDKRSRIRIAKLFYSSDPAILHAPTDWLTNATH